MNKKINLPKKSAGDYIHSVVKGAAGAIPYAGSVLSEFISTVIIPPYERKKEEWMQSIVDSISEVQTKVESFNTKSLLDNTEFQDAIITTTKAAMATSSKIKLESLLNALQNIALNKSPDKITTAIFLNFVDRFTEAHIQICGILDSPKEHRAKRGDYETKESYRELIDKNLGLGSQLVDVIIKELHDNQLIIITKDSIHNRPSFGEENKSSLTPFGKQFIEFIKKPAL